MKNIQESAAPKDGGFAKSAVRTLKRAACLALFILSVLLAEYAYYACWFYFWSKFEWSPFGYETCGLEGLVWLFIVFPFLAVSLLIKIFLVWRREYPKFFCITPLLFAAPLAIFAFDKGFILGIMALSFMIAELAVAICAGIKKSKNTIPPRADFV